MELGVIEIIGRSDRRVTAVASSDDMITPSSIAVHGSPEDPLSGRNPASHAMARQKNKVARQKNRVARQKNRVARQKNRVARQKNRVARQE